MWPKSLIWFTLLGLMCLTTVNTQENAQTRIPASLEECYQNPEIYERDNRLPMTMNMLIELVRKIEDAPDFTMDIRQLSVSLLQRFKLDGIERAPNVQFNRRVIPFSPIGHQFSKHRLLLSRLIPGNAIGFDNNTLTTVERCSLHFMLSNSIETRVRGDEAFRCNQLAQLRMSRIPRSAETLLRSIRSVPKKSNFLGDVELLEELQEHNKRQKVGKYQAEDREIDDTDEELLVEDEPKEELPEPSARGGGFDGSQVDIATNTLSQCPVQNGVVRTTWGSLSAGSVLAGIASGLQQQSVTTRELLALSRPRGGDQYRARQQQPLIVDNRWAATLAGDLAEVALLQAPSLPAQQTVTVGASGGWNRTMIPKWYFLTQRERLEMTDTEIRGGLDGLILAKNVNEYRNRAGQLKLSQLLDMYYSQRGVFSSNVRACDRRVHLTTVASVEEMTVQTSAFSLVLDREMQLRVTLTTEAITQFSSDAAQALSTYIPSSLDDVSCQTTSLVPNDQTIWRTGMDILIYLDASWVFNDIQSVLAYLLDSIDVNPYGSTYTILNANNGEIIVNTTNALRDFFFLFNATNYQNQPPGLSLPNVFESIRTISRNKLEQEKRDGSSGGRSFIALLMPQTAQVNEADSNFAFERLRLIRDEMPDLTMLFFAGGSERRFERFVRRPHLDLFALRVSSSPNENVAPNVNSVIQRIQQIPRRIINPRCGAQWQSGETGTNRMYQYVERGGINFYRLSPNYFFYSSENRKVRIEGQRFGTLSVCWSRTIENPRANSTNQPDVNCIRIDSESYEYNLQNACDGSWLIQDCAPVFISVEAVPLVGGGEETNYRCPDMRECRFPDSLRFIVNTENLGCFSGSERVMSMMAIVLASLIVALKL